MATPVERIDQRVFFVAQAEKRALLGTVLKDSETRRVLVFTRTKHGADKVVRQLAGQPGERPGHPRQQVAETPASGPWPISAAARPGCWWPRTSPLGASTWKASPTSSTTICPNEPECYVHRIGRTARAGGHRRGHILLQRRVSATTCAGIERLIKQRVPVQGPAASVRDAPSCNARARGSRRPSRRARAARAAA